MTLSDNIHQLTNQHLATRNGRLVRVVSLLDQLAAAAAPSLGGGATGSAGVRLPVDTTALDKAMEIEAEARDIQYEMLAEHGGVLRRIIRSWHPHMVPTAEWAAYLDLVTAKWVEEITHIVAPPPSYRPSAPCPRCGQRFTGEDRQPVLSVTYTDDAGKVLHPSAWEMVCAGCKTTWTGDQLGAIAHAIANQTKGRTA